MRETIRSSPGGGGGDGGHHICAGSSFLSDHELEEEEEEEDDDVRDINNVEYELQLRMIDRKSRVVLARDFHRAPLTRQISTPVGCCTVVAAAAAATAAVVDGSHKMRPVCRTSAAYHHRHTLHLNDVELGNGVMRRNLLALNRRRRKKQRLNANAGKVSEVDEAHQRLNGGRVDVDEGHTEEMPFKWEIKRQDPVSEAIEK